MNTTRTTGTPAALSLALGVAGFSCAHAHAQSLSPADRVAAQAGDPRFVTPTGERPNTAALPVAEARPAAASALLVVFVHDQSSDEILRLRDLNGDGDAHDLGEVTVFYDDSPPAALGIDNAQGLVALGPDTLLATDNFDPDNIIFMNDADADGSALGAGEASIWFSGLLPGGFTLTNPADLTPLGDGSYLLLDNNTLDTANPEAIYILEDLNADNDVDDAGEAVLFHELSPVGVSATTTFDAVRDESGFVYTLDITDPNQIESIDIIEPGGATRTEWINSADLFNLVGIFLGTTFELEYIPDSDEILFGASNLSNDQLIVAAKDRNGSNTIDVASELRLVWSEGTHADGFSTGSPRDFARLPDGRLLWTDGLNDRVMLHQDLNGDGDFQELGETTVLYVAATASANGLPTLSLPLSVTGAIVCFADCDGNGALNVDDVDCWVAGFLAGDLGVADCDGNGSLNVDDVDCFVASFLGGCP
ncbi:MAG: hypothetical protein RIB60_00475 [Phycisphaerales bacterium]